MLMELTPGFLFDSCSWLLRDVIAQTLWCCFFYPSFLKIEWSSVVMKYFVSDKFRLYKNLKATKGAACRELHVWYFDFSVHKRATRARYAVNYSCNISTFPFVVGLRGPGMPWVRFVIFRLFRSQTGEEYCDISTFHETFCCLMLMKLTTEPDQQPDQQPEQQMPDQPQQQQPVEPDQPQQQPNREQQHIIFLFAFCRMKD